MGSSALITEQLQLTVDALKLHVVSSTSHSILRLRCAFISSNRTL